MNRVLTEEEMALEAEAMKDPMVRHWLSFPNHKIITWISNDGMWDDSYIKCQTCGKDLALEVENV